MGPPIRCAIVEDDPAVRERLGAAIAAAPGLVLNAAAATAAEGRALASAGGYDVLLCDLGLPDGTGLDVIRAAARAHPEADVLVVTMFAEQAKVLDSIGAGARGYILKGDDPAEAVRAIRDVRAGGSPISPIIARQLLRRLAPGAAAAATPLSDRERDVLQTLARGFSYAETASILGVSAHTVGTHVKNIYRKLDVNSRAEAMFEAGRQGLLP